MTISYNNFTDQVQKIGVQFVFLIVADKNVACDKQNAWVEAKV